LAFFGPKLLDLLQCGLPDENGDGWLGQMLRKSNTAAAPLRHLLLLQAMEVDLEHFFYPHRFSKVAAQVQLPTGPWPCLNAVCEHRGKPPIGQAEPQPPDTNGTRHLIIRCPHCGFAYLISVGTVEQTRASRVIDYGRMWTNKLKQQWSDSTITLRQMAKKLGVDPKTVKQRAFELGLPFPRQGKRSVTKRGIYVTKPRDTSKSLENHRRAWLELRHKQPEAGTKELRSQAQALYAWLYRNDRPWLEQNRPARKKPPVTLAHVDWPKRDEELAGQIATVAAHIKNSPGKPRRVTVTAIGRVLGKQSLFEAALSKLPLTRLMIKNALESGEAFAARRVHMAAAKLRQSQGVFPRWKLVCAAGLHHRLEHRPKVKAALDYEMRPPANVIILRDGEPVPQGVLRTSTKLPRSIRPLAIVQVPS